MHFEGSTVGQGLWWGAVPLCRHQNLVGKVRTFRALHVKVGRQPFFFDDDGISGQIGVDLPLNSPGWEHGGQPSSGARAVGSGTPERRSAQDALTAGIRSTGAHVVLAPARPFEHHVFVLWNWVSLSGRQPSLSGYFRSMPPPGR